MYLLSYIFSKRRRGLLLILMLMLGGLSCKDNPTDLRARMIPSVFFPGDNVIAGWERSLAADHFIEAEDTNGLLEILKSEKQQKLIAETLIAYHYLRGAKQVYEGKIKGATETLELRIFDLEFPNQAQGYFYDKGVMPAAYDFLQTVGDEGRISISSAASNIVIDFYYDKWYTWIYISGRWSAYDAKNVALRFAEKVFDKMLELYPIQP
ncbi:hypothetical protein L0128_10310 [candidate division KSB1 bacterium]|nr:hypothetical protein [candidate division KSB1 bacterium]